MKSNIKAAVASLAMLLAFGACAAGVNRPFLCQPRNGESTCMQDVMVLDDVSLALLAGASDEYVEEAATWVRSLRDENERGWNQVTRRMSVLAMRGALEVDPRKLVVLRRAELKKAKRFLIPVARITTTAVGNNGEAMVLQAVESDSRVAYSDSAADVCATTAKRRYCVRIDGLSKARRVAGIWQPFEKIMVRDFRAATPEPLSAEWNQYTMLGLEVELTDAKPKAINGARVVRASSQRLVLFNDSYLAGLPLRGEQ